MRITRSCSVTLVLMLAALGAGGAFAADAPGVVKEKCSNCHGKDGLSDDSEIPIIAGPSGFFIENQIAVFREEARPCAAEVFEAEDEVSAENHCKLAGSLSEDQVSAAVEHYSGQPFKPADQSVDQSLAGKGASIHEAECTKCHTEGGSLALDDAGILAGQWKPYLMEQLEAYKAGERWQPEKMAPKIDELSEADMKALVEYYASQGPERF